MKEFKVGDKVVIKGVVTKIDEEKHYPIIVEILDGTIFTFTKEGRYCKNFKPQSLFHEIEIT